MEISGRLLELANFYHEEAKKCAKGKAYLAACVMQGSALEAALQCMCFLYTKEVKRTAIYQKKQKNGGIRRKRYKALDLNLHELIKIADELGWFPEKIITWGRRTNLAGFAQELRLLRNHVHPGEWAPKKPETLKFTKDYYGFVSEIYGVASSWLGHHVSKNVVVMLEKEEAKEKKAALG